MTFSLGFGFPRPVRPSGFFASGTVLNFATATQTLLRTQGVSNSVATTNPPGTVTGSTGLVQYGAHNRLVYSGDLTAANWDKISSASVGSTVTPPVTAGTANAYTVSFGSSGSLIRQSGSFPASTTGQVNVYMRSSASGGASNIRITTNNTAAWNTGFSTKVALTNSWQLFTVSGVAQTGNTSCYVIIGRVDATGTDDATCAGNVDIFCPTFGYGPMPAEIVPTTTAAVYAPRLTCDRGATSNSVKNSGDFTAASWSGYLLGTKTFFQPDSQGGATAILLAGDGTSSRFVATATNVAVSGGKTFAFDAKPGSNQYVQIYFDADAAPYANYDVINGTVTATGTTQTAWMTNLGGGWWRCWISTTSSSATNANICIIPASNSARAYSGMQTSAQGTYLGRPQMVSGVVGGFPYLRTYATAPLYASGTPTSQNLLPNSSPSTWTIDSGVTVTGSSEFRLVYPSSNKAVYKSLSGTLVAGQVYTIALDVKATSSDVGNTITVACSTTTTAVTLTAAYQTIYLRSVISAADLTVGITTYGGATARDVTVQNIRVYEGTADLAYTATTGTAVSVYPQRALRREPARTNLFLSSADFRSAGAGNSVTAWSNNDSTITVAGTTAPDGANVGNLVTEGTAGNALVYQDVSATSNAAYSTTVYLKRGNTDWVRLALQDSAATDGVRIWVNLATGALGTVTVLGAATNNGVRVVPSGAGWQRVVIQASNIADTVRRLQICTASADNSTTRVNNGTYYAWGAQLEAGAWATSYIPTVAASVTRSADLIRPGSIITNGPMTVLVQARPDKAIQSSTQLLVARSLLGQAAGIDNAGKPVMYDGTTGLRSGSALSDGVTFRMATQWAASAMSISASGLAPTSGAFDGSMGTGSASIGDDGTGAYEFSGDIESVSVVGIAATDAQLTALSAGFQL